jgi:uncharacterized phage-like protein YoqJ
MRETTMCFSGHRPDKLPFKGDISIPEVKILVSKLCYEIDKSIKQGYTTFISGMAKGVDIWAAKYIIEKKNENKSIKLICAIPYKGYASSWKGVDKWDYGWIIDHADEVVYISEKYTPYCMKKRNEYMVDNSSKLVAVVGDYSSGTGQTIRYAQKKNLSVCIIPVKESIVI